MTKPLDQYPTSKGKSGKLYHRHVCKSCKSSYNKEWKKRNIEHVRQYRRDYHEANREKILARVKKWQKGHRIYKLAYQRAWYLANQARLLAKQNRYHQEHKTETREYQQRHKKRISLRMKAWRKSHEPEIRRYMRNWKQKHSEHIKKYSTEYHKANPEIKRLSEQKRRAWKSGNKGIITAEQITYMYIKQQGICIYCNKPLGKTYQLDHMTPLSRGGPHDISNIQLLCPSCNRRKHAKTHEEYLKILITENT